MNLDPTDLGRPALSRRLRGAALGMLVGTATGGAFAFGLETAYDLVFYNDADQVGAILLLWVFLVPGLGAGALLGTALGWRNASQRHDAAASSPDGSDGVPPDVLKRLGWTALGTAIGGGLFGAAAFGLGVAYFSLFPKIPDEGGTGYTLFLLVLPAGIVTGSICGALAGWHGSARGKRMGRAQTAHMAVNRTISR